MQQGLKKKDDRYRLKKRRVEDERGNKNTEGHFTENVQHV